ncbi:GNAT family N-acetyltransferase [Acidaminobacter sp. JC074]|uniref:GNAT family N-acetyltransferase n=1 Tax=Acidaminobacter sp. JC074 TaxID=2530199 RepID=UPI001F0FC5B1|nr:GNAT family N-acetyltransferase [Acidaminobacter sp. JC074]MCH4889312.1 GNAT family N-acetyltransferase [Acidaminobacter sp. JC074]
MIKKLTEDLLDDFKDFIRQHPIKMDDYFTCDKALNDFNIEDNISYLRYENNQIIGLMTIMKAYDVRLRYAYALDDDLKDLHEACKSEVSSYKVFLEDDSDMLDIFLDLGLTVERKVYALRRKVGDIEVPSLASSYRLEELKIPDDVETFTNIRNTAFVNLKGSRKRAPEEYLEGFQSEAYFKEGTLMLYHEDKPVAVIKGAYEDDIIFVGPIAVDPSYQGKGLGRYLLSSLIHASNNIKRDLELSVNADNEHALKLYTDLGFYVEKKVIALI